MLAFDFYKQLHTTQGLQAWQLQGQLAQGKLLGVYGASGAGKTTFLRLLAGLEQAEQGYLNVKGEEWYNSDKGIDWSPQKRRVGFVFQDYALFPNMTIRQHLEFATTNQQLIQQLLTATDLLRLEKKRPAHLSGGQQQRLALARALALEPSLLLLDEPLSALDQQLRPQLQDLLLELHRAWNCTSILVSHDVDEMLRLADCLLVIEKGQAHWYPAPITYFEEQGLVFSLTVEVVEIGTTNARVQLGTQQFTIALNAEQAQTLQLGQSLKIGAAHSFQILN